jgi:acetyl-CoA C-acetyltransferase
MIMAERVAVVGISNMKCERKRPDVTYWQMLYDAAKEAVEDAGVDPKEIPICLYGAATEVMLRRFIVAPSISEVLGWSGRTLIVYCNAGGSTGATIRDAHLWISSGQAELILVVGGEKISDADVPGHPGFHNIVVYGNDNIFEMPFGTPVAQFGMLCQSYMCTYGVSEEQAAKVSVKNYTNALRNPTAQASKKVTVEDVLKSRVIAYPIKALDCSLTTDVNVAAVFASERVAKKLKKQPIWVEACGYANDTDKLGYREIMNPGTKMCQPQSLGKAAQMAYEMAGIKNPRKEIDIAEIQDGYSWLELMTYEMLGFCGEGQGGRLIDEGVTYVEGELPVNASGGCIGHGHAGGAAGLMSLVEVVRQMRGECGTYQVTPIPKVGLSESMGGSAMSLAGVQILRG